MKKNTKTKIYTAACTIIAFIVVGATPAFAEGSFESYLSNVAIGYDSRNWYDGNLDYNLTTVELQLCSAYSPGNVFTNTTITLWKNVGILPDYNMGSSNNHCNTSSFSRGAADYYHFQITDINQQNLSWSRVSADYLEVMY